MFLQAKRNSGKTKQITKERIKRKEKQAKVKTETGRWVRQKETNRERKRDNLRRGSCHRRPR